MTQQKMIYKLQNYKKIMLKLWFLLFHQEVMLMELLWYVRMYRKLTSTSVCMGFCEVMRYSKYWTLGATSRAWCFTTYSTHCWSPCLWCISTGGFSYFGCLLSKLQPEAESQMMSALVLLLPLPVYNAMLWSYCNCCVTIHKYQCSLTHLKIGKFQMMMMTTMMMKTLAKRIETIKECAKQHSIILPVQEVDWASMVGHPPTILGRTEFILPLFLVHLNFSWENPNSFWVVIVQLECWTFWMHSYLWSHTLCKPIDEGHCSYLVFQLKEFLFSEVHCLKLRASFSFLLSRVFETCGTD